MKRSRESIDARWIRHVVFSIAALLGCFALLGIARIDDAAAAEATPDGRNLLPKLTDETGTTEATGRIASSTRGQPGPVRLVLELKDGDSLAVLVAPDDLCTHLGLSLQPDQEVTVIGQEVKGSRPLLVARMVVENGKRIAVRDAEGRWIRAPRAAASAAPAPPGGLPKSE